MGFNIIKIVGGDFYETIEGNYHIFSSNTPHYGVSSEDNKLRCVVNIVYT